MYATTQFCPDPWRGVKRSNIFIFQLQSQFHRFVYQTLYVFDQLKDIKYKKGFLFSRHGHAPGVGLWGARDQFCLSLPKPLDEIQTNLVCELFTWIGRAQAHFSSPLGALQRRQKVKYHLINYKANFKDFITKLCLLTNKKLYKISNAI